MTKPEVLILKTDGINCDEEMAHAFTVAGGNPEIVHINQLRAGDRHLADYGVLAIPGGFSYGDDIASGKILATELTSYLSDQLQDFVDADKPILGVCNGFQTLIRTGLLPNGTLGEQQATLADNEVGHFECRWIDLKVARTACKFVRPEDFEGQVIPMQTAHGEGRFLTNPDILDAMEDNGQIVFRYSSPTGEDPEGFPANPNGSIHNIAGVTDPSGLILGLMPHPERSITSFHPHRARTEIARTAATSIFTNIVEFAS